VLPSIPLSELCLCCARTGTLGGIICWWSAEGLRSIGVDDPLDASSVHGACGIWGCVAVGFFDVNDGLFYGGSGKFFGYQVAGVIAIFAWVATFASIFFGLFRLLGVLRVSEEVELKGLDHFEHGGSAYHIPKMRSSSLQAVISKSGHDHTARPGDEDQPMITEHPVGAINIEAAKNE